MAPREAPGRVACQVPHCPKTVKGDPAAYVWICADHWRLGDPQIKAIWRRARRQAKDRKATWLWWKLRDQIIERAAGIG